MYANTLHYLMAAEASQVNGLGAYLWVFIETRSDLDSVCKECLSAAMGYTLCSLKSSGDVALWLSQCQWR